MKNVSKIVVAVVLFMAFFSFPVFGQATAKPAIPIDAAFREASAEIIKEMKGGSKVAIYVDPNDDFGNFYYPYYFLLNFETNLEKGGMNIIKSDFSKYYREARDGRWIRLKRISERDRLTWQDAKNLGTDYYIKGTFSWGKNSNNVVYYTLNAQINNTANGTYVKSFSYNILVNDQLSSQLGDQRADERIRRRELALAEKRRNKAGTGRGR